MPDTGMSILSRRFMLAAAGLALCAWSGDTRAADLTTVKIGVEPLTVSSLPLFVAQSTKTFQKQGLDVEFVAVEGAARSFQVLLSGNTKSAIGGISLVANANDQGGDVRMIAVTCNTIPLAMLVTPEIKASGDLKGKKIGVSMFGSEGDTATNIALQRLGLTRKDVTVVQTGGLSQRLAALKAKQIDGSLLVEPTTTKALDEGLHILVDLSAEHVPWQWDGLTVNADDLKANRAIYVSLTKALAEAAYIVFSDEKRTKQIIADAYKVSDAKTLDNTYKLLLRVIPKDLSPSAEAATYEFDQLRAAGTKVSSAPVSSMIDTSVVKQIKKEGYFDQLKKQYNVN